MSIKNIIFDLGGVWLPIDERRTLAAFAELMGSPAGGAACETGALGKVAMGEKPAASLEKPSNFVAVSEGSDRGLTGAGLATGSTGTGPVESLTDKDKAESQMAALAAQLQPDVLAYELGAIDDRALLARLGCALRRAPDTPPASDETLTAAWNAMLLPFPETHLPLLDAFGADYRIFLLSNTNALHIRYVEEDFQRRFPDRKPFLQHFEKAYLSHELHLRKPQPEIYTHVLKDAGLRADETLFIDDRTENVAAAAALGFHTILHPANAPLTELPL